jgi:hypothetical protein
LTGVNAEDERFSWRVAVVAMLVLSVVASLAFVLKVNPFAISFNITFVYLPTAVLILGPLVKRARRKSESFG